MFDPVLRVQKIKKIHFLTCGFKIIAKTQLITHQPIHM